MKLSTCANLTEMHGELTRRYAEKRPNSQALHLRALRSLPGGDSRSVLYYRPFPAYVQKGNGCRIVDKDNLEYIDFVNNYTSLILGHCNQKVVESVQAQVSQTSCVAAPNEFCVSLAEIIAQRVPSVKLVRFCNSGTEATLSAIKISRVFTGRKKIIMMEGCYHGSLQAVELDSLPTLRDGHLQSRRTTGESKDNPSVIDDAIRVPINDDAALLNAVERHGSDIAAVIAEPMLGSGGALPLTRSYLQLLRDVTHRIGAVLIFDEVQTLRSSPGGIQKAVQIIPDLTCLGKIIGGGYPVGAIGGRPEIMDLYSPAKSDFVAQSGTFNANPVTMAAGIATMNQVDGTSIDRLNTMAEDISQRITRVAQKIGIRMTVTGYGSIRNVHPNPQSVTDYSVAVKDDRQVLACLHLLLLENGIFIAPRGMFNLSTPMGANELNQLEEAIEESLDLIHEVLVKTGSDLVSK